MKKYANILLAAISTITLICILSMVYISLDGVAESYKTLDSDQKQKTIEEWRDSQAQ